MPLADESPQDFVAAKHKEDFRQARRRSQDAGFPGFDHGSHAALAAAKRDWFACTVKDTIT
jgi:hypothetical protein